MTCKLLCLLLLGLVAFAYAVPVNEDDSESDEDGLTTLVPLEDDSEEERFSFWTNSKGKNRCTCSTGKSCQCCASPTLPIIGKQKACLKANIDLDDKLVDISIVSNDKTVISKKVSLAKAGKICDRLPGKLNGVKICLYTEMSDLPDKSGIQCCPRLSVRKDKKTIGRMQFACVQFKDEKLSLNDNGEVPANDLFSISTGNAWKGFLNAIGARKPSGKEDSNSEE